MIFYGDFYFFVTNRDASAGEIADRSLSARDYRAVGKHLKRIGIEPTEFFVALDHRKLGAA